MVCSLFRCVLGEIALLALCFPAFATDQAPTDLEPKKAEMTIVGAEIRRPLLVAKAEAAGGVQGQRHLFVEVENPNDEQLYVWSSRRAYDYDASTRILVLYLTEHTPQLPSDIRMISDHPRTPMLVAVNGKSHGTLDVPVPATIRRRVPGAGLGMSFVEEPIGQIERVELHIQYSTEPLQDQAEESPVEHRKRLLAHGDVAQAVIEPIEHKKR
jgi:hypothetical protein